MGLRVHDDCWSFQDKADVTQLQAADIWAWENYRYAVDFYFPKQAECAINGRTDLTLH